MAKYYIFIAILCVFSLVLLIGGFIIVGSPISAHDKELDQKRISDFSAINQQIQQYWNENHYLPESLAQAMTQRYSISITDPETKKQYDYQKITSTSYQLCAQFLTDATGTSVTGASLQNPIVPYGTEGNYLHKKGYDCLSFSITNLYPQRAAQITLTPTPTFDSSYNPFSTVLTGPTNGGVNTPLVYTAQIGDTDSKLVSATMLWGFKVDSHQNHWESNEPHFTSGSQTTFSQKITFPSPGTYWVFVNINDANRDVNHACTGNPSFTSTELLQENLYPCGQKSSLVVTIK